MQDYLFFFRFLPEDQACPAGKGAMSCNEVGMKRSHRHWLSPLVNIQILICTQITWNGFAKGMVKWRKKL